MKKNKGLGRGLSALMADVSIDASDANPASEARVAERYVPIESLEANPEQPRKDFVREALQELSDSIRAKGIIQPLIVRQSPRDTSKYEIVAGERRWRAAQIAQLHEVPVIERELDDVEVLEVAIIENIQRADLNAIEEGLGYRQLIDRFGHTQEQLGEALGKSRSHIANVMRLLQLPGDVQKLLRDGKMSAGHARALITSDNPSALARQVVAKNLSVRDTERLVKKAMSGSGGTGQAPKRSAPEKDADTRALESDLSANLKMKVRIDHQGDNGAGRIVISYDTLEQLDALCQYLSVSPLDVTR